MMLVSSSLFGTTTGLPMLDVFDKFAELFCIRSICVFNCDSKMKTRFIGNQMKRHLSVGFLHVYALY